MMSALTITLLAGCWEARSLHPEPKLGSPDVGDGTRPDASPGDDAAPAEDAGSPFEAYEACPAKDLACVPAEDDYQPRIGDPDDEPYSDCVADDDRYHPFDGLMIGAIARIRAFETIADALWQDPGPPPDSADFLEAAGQYALAEGIESGVTRREDVHYPCVDDGAGGCLRCRDLTAAEIIAHCDRCVGQCRMQPLVRDALDAGIAGKQALLNAARVEAGLLWYLYVTTYKECAVCEGNQGDCDSCWAHYTGGFQRDEDVLGLGLAVQRLDREAFDRTFDGILAFDCWDDLDDASLPWRDDLALRDLALAQVDRALLRGVASILQDRIEQWDSLPAGAEKDAAWEFISILGPVLQREAELRDPEIAARLDAAWSSGGAVADRALNCDIETVFPCP